MTALGVGDALGASSTLPLFQLLTGSLFRVQVPVFAPVGDVVGDFLYLTDPLSPET